MATYRIRIQKPGKQAPHYSIVAAPSIKSAEYYAIEHMILSTKSSIEDHHKMAYTPFLKVQERSSNRSAFEFRTSMINRSKEKYIVVIALDNKAKPSIHYQIEYDESIFDMWPTNEHREPDDPFLAKNLAFFTKEDLQYFSKVIGTKISSRSPESLEIGTNLTTKGVHAKTHYWAKLLEREGYPIEFRYDWQHSGVVRKHTWARIYLPQFKGSLIFFNIGVVVRVTENNHRESFLLCKLDCRRDQLTDSQVEIFESFLEENAPGARGNLISGDDVQNERWESLVQKSLAFIETYTKEYEELVSIINTDTARPKKLARLCWNEKGWEEPSGPVGKSKSTAKSFEKEKGYGYEEWLFDTTKQIDGFHYSFLQQFNKGNHEGKTYDVHLYALRNSGKINEKFWVGRIKRLEVISKSEAKKVIDIYKKKGWYGEMLSQLNDLGIHGFNFEPVNEDEIFNIRFKVESSTFIRFNPYRPVDDFDQEIGSNHYVLLDKKDVSEDDKPFELAFAEGHNSKAKKGIITSRYSNSSYVKSLKHREIQDNIYNQLKTQYRNMGVKVRTELPTPFGTSIDLVVHHPVEGYSLYEIKTGNSALGCIREAIGQLIEYCYYPNACHASKLIVVAPHPVDFRIRQYMRHLRETLHIRIFYQYYSLDESRLDENIA